MRRAAIPLSVLLLVTAGGAAQAADCAAEFAAHERTDLTLPYERFDQTEGSGFRVLARQHCFTQAERLILDYLPQQQAHASALYWHAAQMAASAGEYERASAETKHARDVEPPPGGDGLMWDEYLLASIAFFDRDKDALRVHRDHIAATGMAVEGNRMNVNMLDTMLDEFDADYDKIGADALRRWQQHQHHEASHRQLHRPSRAGSSSR